MIYNMRILTPIGTTFLDYPDNISHAMIVYFVGCDNECGGCQNPEFKDYFYSLAKDITVEELYNSLFILSSKVKTNKLVLSGGDPLFKGNIRGVNNFIRKYKNEFDICVYTGKSIELVKNNVEPGFKYIKVNKFDNSQRRESKKTDELFQLSSPNQSFFDCNYKCVTEDGIYYFNKGVQDV